MIRAGFVLTVLLLLGSGAEAAQPSYVWTELVGDAQSVALLPPTRLVRC